jgi:hypothetical protein
MHCKLGNDQNKSTTNPALLCLIPVLYSISISVRAYLRALLTSMNRFDFFSLDDTHLMALARGPLSDASESYRTAAWGSDAPRIITNSTSNSTSHSSSRAPAVSRSLFDASDDISTIGREACSGAIPPGEAPPRVHHLPPRLDDPLPPLVQKTIEELLADEQPSLDDISEEESSCAEEGSSSSSGYHTPKRTGARRKGFFTSFADGDDDTSVRMCVAL